MNEVVDIERKIENIDIEKEEKVKEKIKKKFTIFGFTIINLLAYFIIYSVIGFVIY